MNCNEKLLEHFLKGLGNFPLDLYLTYINNSDIS